MYRCADTRCAKRRGVVEYTCKTKPGGIRNERGNLVCGLKRAAVGGGRAGHGASDSGNVSAGLRPAGHSGHRAVGAGHCVHGRFGAGGPDCGADRAGTVVRRVFLRHPLGGEGKAGEVQAGASRGGDRSQGGKPAAVLCGQGGRGRDASEPRRHG